MIMVMITKKITRVKVKKIIICYKIVHLAISDAICSNTATKPSSSESDQDPLSGQIHPSKFGELQGSLLSKPCTANG